MDTLARCVQLAETTCSLKLETLHLPDYFGGPFRQILFKLTVEANKELGKPDGAVNLEAFVENWEVAVKAMKHVHSLFRKSAEGDERKLITNILKKITVGADKTVPESYVNYLVSLRKSYESHLGPLQVVAFGTRSSSGVGARGGASASSSAVGGRGGASASS